MGGANTTLGVLIELGPALFAAGRKKGVILIIHSIYPLSVLFLSFSSVFLIPLKPSHIPLWVVRSDVLAASWGIDVHWSAVIMRLLIMRKLL